MQTRLADERPVFSQLSTTEAHSILARNHVGRLAYVVRGHIDIEPVHYVASQSWIYVRSAQGTKLKAFEHRPFAAFEVDEVDDTFDWRSVVAHGTIYVMSEPRSHSEHADLDRALRTMRTFIPETMTRDDPTPLRQTIYGMHIDDLSGRKAVRRAPHRESRS